MSDQDDIIRARNRDLGLAYARAAGLGTGLFLLAWLPLNSARWMGQGPEWLLTLESIVFGGVALLLLLPWKKLFATRVWKPLYVVLCLFAVAFVFTLIADLMFQYMLAAENRAKPAPPAFQSTLLFVVLMQPPVILFLRKPSLLD